MNQTPSRQARLSPSPVTMRNHMHRALRGVTLLSIACLAAGCRPDRAAPVLRPDSLDSLATEKESEQTWDIILMQDLPIGFVSTTVTPESAKGELVTRWEQVTELDVKRFGDRLKQTIHANSLERRSGGLEEANWQMLGAGTIVGGTVVPSADGKSVTFRPSDGSPSLTQPWQPSTGGFFAVEQSLRSSPLQSGESRTLRGVIPMLNQVARFTLKAAENESVTIFGQSRSLLRIENEIELADGNTLHATLWMHADGGIHKQAIRELGQVLLRTDESTARSATSRRIDLGQLTTVKLKHAGIRTLDLHNAKQATYHIRRRAPVPPHPSPFTFADDTAQTATAHDDGYIEIRIDRTCSDPFDMPPSAANAASVKHPALTVSRLIPHDNPTIRQLTASALSDLPGSDDILTIAHRLERFVRNYIEHKDYSQMLLDARQVAEKKRGDCTEHAVLLTAMCRAHKIPTRGAIGLVYVASEDGFVFHMWNESLIEGHWFPLDATLGQGGIGVGHIKVTTTNFSNDTTMSDFLPLASIVGQIELELVSVER